MVDCFRNQLTENASKLSLWKDNLLQLCCLSWIFSLRVWKDMSGFGIMENHRLVAICKMPTTVLMFCLKLYHNIKNYKKTPCVYSSQSHHFHWILIQFHRKATRSLIPNNHKPEFNFGCMFLVTKMQERQASNFPLQFSVQVYHLVFMPAPCTTYNFSGPHSNSIILYYMLLYQWIVVFALNHRLKHSHLRLRKNT